MKRIRVSTTVDGDLLDRARNTMKASPTPRSSTRRCARSCFTIAPSRSMRPTPHTTPTRSTNQTSGGTSPRSVPRRGHVLHPSARLTARCGGANHPTSAGGRSSCSRATWRSDDCAGRWSRHARPRSAGCPARSRSSLTSTLSPDRVPSTSTRWRACRSPSSSSASVVSAVSECDRSAPPSRSPSTARTDAVRSVLDPLAHLVVVVADLALALGEDVLGVAR